MFCISFSDDRFCFSNSADTDEILQTASFHLGLHCLQEYLVYNGFGRVHETSPESVSGNKHFRSEASIPMLFHS